MARSPHIGNNDLIDDICYDSWWLPKDMENMGYIFEYCDKYCKDVYNVEINKLKFLNDFMRSRIRFEMETGHPALLSQAARTSVRKFISVDHLGNIEQFKLLEGEENNYCHNQMYWVGWMYAYLHFQEKVLSKELVEILPIETMLEHYYLGHEMDRSVYHKRVMHLFDK